ncbi:GGDEF domain-containing response regulator [Butyrivibrio sp. FCS014]|uniref:GGDEF domain-containing response regulator n=1 Tax=Butyrivibrio sp. FCS014 TaxID=1408304 RepID=UPI000464B9D7|nr:diguanylate cyclase [Butyrivibrio sp. FCS014]
MMELRIAIVDDDPVILMHAKDILSAEKMRTSCMNSGKQLLKYIENNTPDLILLDIMMPEMDGFDTYIQLRKFEEHSGRAHVPVIFITGEDDSETEEMGLVMGASDFIKKPFKKDVLVRRIELAIRNSRKIGDLEEEATIDKLTGMYNKAKGTDRVSKLCKRKNGALMILDLDSFKLVNDLFGHEKGDRILKAFSDIAKKNSRETDTLCRIGGDEFMGFYDDLLDERAVGSLTGRLNSQLQAAADELLGEGHGVPLGISIGVVMIPEYGRDYNELFALADSALYKVKQNGKHGYAIYGAVDSDSEAETENSETRLNRLVQIVEERNDKSGALFLGKDYFSVVYKYMMRFYRRYGGDAAVVLFELEPPTEDFQFILEAADQFSKFVEKTLRMSDIMVQSGSRSFLVMLTECPSKEIEKVIQRLIGQYKDTEYGSAVNVNYVYKYNTSE